MPEALKNLLLVMASRGILTEQWRVRRWHQLQHSISSSGLPACQLICAVLAH